MYTYMYIATFLIFFPLNPIFNSIWTLDMEASDYYFY